MVRVRGLRAPQAGPVRHCLHCGVPLVSETAHGSGFCCGGCAYVHRLVHDRGLDDYYKIRDAIVAPVDPSVFQARDFTWLTELQGAAEKAAGTPDLELEVQGISCAGCVWLIERLFHQQPGALAIETDAQLGRFRLRWTKGEFHAGQFAQILHSFNYLVGPSGEEPEVPESRRLVRRIGLCAAFSMNVMLFTLPVYFGMTTDFAYARLFGLLAMAFATFSVLSGGIYFLNRAMRALREGVMHIDLPIAVGIAGAYLGSVYGWLSGREQLIYFDFVSAFILLMLTGRWAQIAAVERNRHRLLRGRVGPRKVRIDSPQGVIERAVEELSVADVFFVRPGEVVPVEAFLDSPNATFGTAWIDGESEARAFRQGARIPAGGINLNRTEISLRAAQPWSESLLRQLLRSAQRDVHRDARLERIIRGYLIGIFLVATVVGIGWWLATHNAARAWTVVTSVLVVSCPCAIGLAFPLADEIATLSLRRRGIFIRENDLWPRLGRVRKVIFDKTGTLTLEHPVLQEPELLTTLSPEARDVLLMLVRDNPHPVCQSLFGALLMIPSISRNTAIPGDVSEEIGLGIILQTDGARWSLGRPGWRGTKSEACDLSYSTASPGSDAEFARDGVVFACFRFSDSVRPGAREEILALQKRGLATYILSGDRKEKVVAMAAALGIASENAVAGATPLQKAGWVRAIDRHDTLMLGDGANDSLAFDAAWVRGTPVIHRGVLENKADFYYLGQNLAAMRLLFEADERRRRIQCRLLFFSVTYNFIAVGLAATGRMNPLIAAVLMPLSSLVTLGIVMGGTRQSDAGLSGAFASVQSTVSAKLPD